MPPLTAFARWILHIFEVLFVSLLISDIVRGLFIHKKSIKPRFLAAAMVDRSLPQGATT
jgi:hypothetical protein